VLVVVVACGLSVVFWAVYEQGGNSVVLYVHERVDRSVGGFTIPTEWFQSINPLFVVAFTPVLSTFWRRAESTSAPTTTAASKHTSLMRMGTGSCLLGAAFLLLGVVDASAAGGDVHSLYIVWYVAVLVRKPLLPPVPSTPPRKRPLYPRQSHCKDPSTIRSKPTPDDV
jgi:POT family proton-dependent oligopeptide transporter